MIRPFVGRVARSSRITVSYIEDLLDYVYFIPENGTHFRIGTYPDPSGKAPNSYSIIANDYAINQSLNTEFYVYAIFQGLVWMNYINCNTRNRDNGLLWNVEMPLSPQTIEETDIITLSYPHGNAWARYQTSSPTLVTTSLSFSDYLNFINSPPIGVSNIQIVGYY